MSRIVIESGGNTSNHDSLEAVTIWMFKNVSTRDYQKTRRVTVASGRRLKVTELEQETDGLCDGKFLVEGKK